MKEDRRREKGKGIVEVKRGKLLRNMKDRRMRSEKGWKE